MKPILVAITGGALLCVPILVSTVVIMTVSFSHTRRLGREQLSLAQSAERKGALDEALFRYKRCLCLLPKDPDAQVGVVRIQNEQARMAQEKAHQEQELVVRARANREQEERERQDQLRIETAREQAPPEHDRAELKPARTVKDAAEKEPHTDTAVVSLKTSAEKYAVWYKGGLVPIAKLTRAERSAAGQYLEAAFEDCKNHGGVPGGEVAIRKMLRAICYAMGPNTDRNGALQWKAVCILAANVRVEWKDTSGSKQLFQSKIDNPEQLRGWIDREMRRLSDIVFEKSMGKVNIVPEVFVSRAPLIYFRQSSRGGCWCTAAGAKPVIDEVFGIRKAHSIFVWIPTEGIGRFPPVIGAAHVAPPEKDTRDAILTVAYTSRERMEKVGGWASPDGAGILHEFWHNVQEAMKGMVGFRGFVPTNHGEKDFDMLKAEYREQGFPEPKTRYDALLCSYPTWKMCEALGSRVGR